MTLPFGKETVVFNVASKFVSYFEVLSVNWATQASFLVLLSWLYFEINSSLNAILGVAALDSNFAVKLESVAESFRAFTTGYVHLNLSVKFEFKWLYTVVALRVVAVYN
jgi:hypothetical protein